MRHLVVTAITLVTGVLGGIAGWWVAVAMDRFRWLGPEEFWRTDPESVWVWGFTVGGMIGMATAIGASVWWLRRSVRPLAPR